MANRRMFSLDIVGTDKFLELPVTAQCLYFHLGMRADDDGFVSSPKQVIKMVSCTNGDIRILAENGYIIPFETGIVVIRHWKQNNYLRADRYTQTVHQKEKSRLLLVDGVYQLKDSGIPDGTPPVYTGKYSIDKYSIDKYSINTICSEPEASEPVVNPQNSGITLTLNDNSVYNVPFEDIEKWKEAFPAVDIEQELRKMSAWLDANRTKRKTKRGINRFIVTWLSKEQDRGGRYRNVQRQQDSHHESRWQQESKEFAEKHYRNLPSSPDDPFQEV